MVTIGIFLFVLICFQSMPMPLTCLIKTPIQAHLYQKMRFKGMGIPKAIASDDGGEFKGRIKDILDAEGIQHIIMTTHLSCIDRFTRTIKHMIFERVQHTTKDWHMLLPNLLEQYNNTIHDSTKLKPVNAIQNENAVDVKTNLMLKARFKRKCKEMNSNDL